MSRVLTVDIPIGKQMPTATRAIQFGQQMQRLRTEIEQLQADSDWLETENSRLLSRNALLTQQRNLFAWLLSVTAVLLVIVLATG